MAQKLRELFNNMRQTSNDVSDYNGDSNPENVLDLVKILNTLQKEKNTTNQPVNPFEPNQNDDAPSSMEYSQEYIDQLNINDEDKNDDMFNIDYGFDDDLSSDDLSSDDLSSDDLSSDDLSSDESSIYDLLKTLTISGSVDDIENDSDWTATETSGEFDTIPQSNQDYDEQEESDINLEPDEAGMEPDEAGMEPDEADDPDRQGAIRRVKGAHLVYKRKEEDGTYSELWIYNITNANDRLSGDVRDNILAATDIDPTDVDATEGDQSYKIWTAGNAQLLVITGLPQ